MRLADLRVRQGRFEEAEQLLRGLDTHVEAAVPLAATFLKRREPTLAIVVLTRALGEVDPTSVGAGTLWAPLVDAQIAAGNCHEAAKAVDGLVGCATRHPGSYLRATAALARGRLCLAETTGDPCGCLREPYAEHAAFKADVEGNFFTTLEMSPNFAERVRSATRVDRFHGSPVPNFFRTPYGPGWALVGDAGYTKDPITAQGISNAFRDAELCSDALDATFAGRAACADAMKGYQAHRDAKSMPMYEFTAQLTTLEPPTADLQQLLGGIYGNQAAMDAFVSITAGTLSPADFFDPANMAALMAPPAMSR